MSIGRGTATHWKGPILGDHRAYGGLFEDVGIGEASRALSNYIVWYEEFHTEFVDGVIPELGCTLTDRNTATVPATTVTAENNFLLLNPGTKADSGTEYQFIAAPSQATYRAPAIRIPGLVTSTTTLMDNRELFWACRFGLASDLAGAWDGKVIMGWITTDTTMLINTDGLPGLPTGGGIGFHIGEGGLMTFFGQQAALTVAGTTTGVNFNAAPNLITVAMGNWNTVGFRWRCTDASDGTGRARFFVNGRQVGQILTGLPMASTEGYGVSLGIQNGPTQLSDMGIDWMVTGITRPGLTATII